MPSIDAYRIINVTYGTKNRIDDLNIETDGRHTIVVIPNGCGKTFTITLLLQTILPGSALNNRTFDETFANVKGTAHIVLSHLLDNGEDKLITGITVNNEGSLRYFNWCFETPVDQNLSDIPLVDDAMTLSYEETRDWLREMPYDKRAKVFNQGERGKLSKHLSLYGIYGDEWEMMYKMNMTEGGVKNIFGSRSRKSTDDLLKEFVIPAITRELKGSEEIDHVQDSFLKKIDTLKMIPQWEDEIRRMDEYLTLFGRQVEKLKTLYERGEDYRVRLYLLKLINERTKETLGEKLAQSERIELTLKGQLKGIDILKKNALKLTYANLLHQITMIKEKIGRTLQYLTEAEEERNHKKKQLQLIQAMDDLTDFNATSARYDIIKAMIDKKQMEDLQLKEQMAILESKLHDYYTIAIRKTGDRYESNAELISQTEDERDELTGQMAALQDKKRQQKKELDFLEQISEEIDKLGGLKAYDEARESTQKIQNEIGDKQTAIEKLKEEIETLKEESHQEKERELTLRQQRDQTKEAYQTFSNKQAVIKQIKQVYHANTVDELYDLLSSQLETTQRTLLSNGMEQADLQEIIDYISRFNTVPPERTVKKLASQLREAGFQDFIPGYEYLKEKGDINNKLVSYGIICENLKGLSMALNKIGLPEAPVFVFSRKELDDRADVQIKGLLRQKNLFIETRRLSILTGHLTVEAYLADHQKTLERIEKNIEKYTSRESELKLHLHTVEQFIEQYGIDPAASESALHNQRTQAIKEWESCSNALDQIQATVEKKKGETVSIQAHISNLKEKLFQLEGLCRKFEDLGQRCRYVVDRLQEVPITIEAHQDSVKQLEGQLETGQHRMREIKTHLKRLTSTARQINEELGGLKQKQKGYKKAEQPGNNDYLYNGEPVEGLEEKLHTLKLRFEDNQLMDEERRLSQQLSQIRSAILRKGYTVAELNRIDRSTLPTPDDCNKAVDELQARIDRLNRSLGTHEAEKKQLEKQRDELKLLEEDRQTIQPIDNKTYRALFEKNRTRLTSLEKAAFEERERFEVIKSQIHKSEILHESQREFLSGFSLPEKVHIKQLDPALFQQDEMKAWNNAKTNFLTVKESLEQDQKAVEAGWNSLQKSIHSETYDMNLNMALIMESDTTNILFDYQKIKNLYEQDQHMITTSREMIELNISKNKQEMETLVENAYRSVECYLNEFANLSKYSRIETHGKRDVSVKFIFPELSQQVKKSNLKAYIDEILNKINHIEKDRVKEFVSKNFSVKRLIEEIHRKKTVLKVYKPSTSAGWYYEDWDNVIKWSQGEQFFAFFLLYASMSIWIRQKRMGLSKSKTVLIADNPFGEAISEHIFNPLLEFMSDNQIQLITFTAIKERQIIALFPNKYSLILYPQQNTKSLIIQPGFFREEF